MRYWKNKSKKIYVGPKKYNVELSFIDEKWHMSQTHTHTHMISALKLD